MRRCAIAYAILPAVYAAAKMLFEPAAARRCRQMSRDGLHAAAAAARCHAAYFAKELRYAMPLLDTLAELRRGATFDVLYAPCRALRLRAPLRHAAPLRVAATRFCHDACRRRAYDIYAADVATCLLSVAYAMLRLSLMPLCCLPCASAAGAAAQR